MRSATALYVRTFCFLSMVSVSAFAAETELDETFAPGSERAWTREAGSSPAALAFHGAGAPIGLAFDPALGYGSIWRRVDLGSGGCEVSCEIELARGNAEPWRWPGMVVALCSAEPAAMKDDDWALALSLHKQGLRVTAVRKGVFQPQQKTGKHWQFNEQEIPKRYQVSMGGAGGHHFSLQWPGKNLASQRVKLWAARTTDGHLHFAASHIYGPGATWWEADCALPTELASKPLRVLAVRTVREVGAPVPWTEPLDPTKPPGVSMPSGVLRRVSVRALKEGETPKPPVFEEDDLPKEWSLKPAEGEIHPSLYGDAKELAKVRERLKDPRWQAWRQMLIKQDKIDGKLFDPNRIGVQLSSCVWAWTLTGETSAREHALALIDRVTTATDDLPKCEHNWPGRVRQTIDLDEFACHAIEGLATAYDLLHREMGESRRRAVLRVLHRGLDYYRDRMRANDWWYANNPSNTIGVAAGCHGIGALALRTQRPKDVEEVLDRAAKAIQERYIGIADDGGCLEGTLYWQYGGMYPVVFGLALERALGDSRGLLDLPRFKHAGAYARTILGGDGEMTCFNDTQPWLSGLLPMALCGGRHKDPLSLWLVDRMAALAAADSKMPLAGDQRNAGPALLLRGGAFPKNGHLL